MNNEKVNSNNIFDLLGQNEPGSNFGEVLKNLYCGIIKEFCILNSQFSKPYLLFIIR